jgi:hypothetical protein
MIGHGSGEQFRPIAGALGPGWRGGSLWQSAADATGITLTLATLNSRSTMTRRINWVRSCHL